jgi:phenylacetate-CoA ligase
MNGLFRKILEWSGFPFSAARDRLAEVQQLKTRSQATDYQRKMAWELFEHHRRNNPAYAGILGDRVIEKWEDIPVLRKLDIQMPFEERLTKGIPKNQLHTHYTSGSSGKPFFFAKDKFAHAMFWSVIDNRYGWHGVNMGADIQARFYGITLRKPKYYTELIKDRLAGRIRYPVYDLSDTKLEQILASMKRRRLAYINGYTSALVLFAKFLLARGLTLKKECPHLKVVIPTSEVCDDIDKATLEKAFGVRVANEYGAADADIIAFHDKDFDWVVNYETLLVEILDDDGKPVADGEEGRVVVTLLYNRAMPFIRYEIGDRAVLESRTKGPYQVMKQVIGRTNDIVKLPNGVTAGGMTLYYVIKKYLEDGGKTKEMVIRQKALDRFHIEYVADKDLTDDDKKILLGAMDQYLIPGLETSFERKETIERSAAGKLKHFYSELPA